MKPILTLILLLIIEFPVFSQQVTDWSSLNMYMSENSPSYNISVVDSNIIWGSFLGNSLINGQMVFLTVDGGQNFEVFTLPILDSISVIFDIYALDENTAFTASLTPNSDSQAEGIHRTTDGGQNWDLIFNNEDNDFSAIKVHFYNPLDGFVYGYTGAFNGAFFYTSDGGDTWEKSESEFNINAFYTEGGNDGGTVLGDTAWCSSVNSRIFRSVDRGITWTSHLMGNSNRVFNDIAFKNNNQGLAISSLDNSGNNVANLLFKTEDGGITWSWVPSSFLNLASNVDANNISYIPGTEGGYLITSGITPINKKFLFTLDNGNTWNEGVAPFSLLNAEFLSPTIGFGGTFTSDGGLLKFNDNIFSAPTAVNELIIDNSALLVYPNPVSDQLQISLENKWQGELNIQVVNGLGQTVRSTSFEKNETRFSQKMNVAELPIGIYRLLVSDGEEMMVQAFVKK
jgi:photosystem II stability/assembly factor-like uncharacterized protein